MEPSPKGCGAVLSSVLLHGSLWLHTSDARTRASARPADPTPSARLKGERTSQLRPRQGYYSIDIPLGSWAQHEGLVLWRQAPRLPGPTRGWEAVARAGHTMMHIFTVVGG
jgi:hypothetical protein